jgi:bifunctional non-homologous end joining protein LigD
VSLRKYQQKRKFPETPEPKGKIQRRGGKPLTFMIHEHHATRLHFDLRLELDGVLKSWAVPKGPSFVTGEKRLAVQVEDHPLEYGKFKGIIPEGNYGAGEVLIWDNGTYGIPGVVERTENEQLLRAGLKKGHLILHFEGKKLLGEYDLVRMGNQPQNWLLIRKTGQGPVAGRRMIEPMTAKLSPGPFDRKDWIFEVKWDGYRAIAVIDNGIVDLYSRNGLSFNEDYPLIREELARLKGSMILDGEIVIVDEQGRADFQLLQEYQKTGQGNLVYYVFDILELNGENLRELTLSQRKDRLAMVLKKKLPMVIFNEFIEKEGKAFFQAAVDMGLEGIMAKDWNSPYLEGKRSDYWLKIKNLNQQEAVIFGKQIHQLPDLSKPANAAVHG